MKFLSVILGAELKNVRRDSFLAWLVIYPLFLALVLRIVLPYLTEYANGYNIDLVHYYPVILSYMTLLLVPIIFGIVVGFSLIDERDDGTLTALRVTPLPIASYMFFKTALVMLASIMLTFVTLPLSNIIAVDLSSVLPIAILASLEAPIFGLLINSFAKNKVEAFAVMKFLGVLFIAPLGAFFIAGAWSCSFMIFPAYWPLKAFWNLAAGKPYWWLIVTGIIYHLVILFPLYRRFVRRL